MSDEIRDYITGKALRATPEEYVRQQFEHFLVDELGYPKKHLTIEFVIQRGSRRGAEEADIAVFKSDKHNQKNLYMVVETEPPGHAFDEQVFSYATATTAEFVAWFDGTERKSRGSEFRWRDMATDPTTFIEIPTLPKFGESIDEIGQYEKSQLKPVKSLKTLFEKMHNRLYGEGPLKREDEIAQEVIKLLFCKLFDELYTPGLKCEFRASVSELRTAIGRSEVAKRVRRLFDSLKSDPAYGDMFTGEELHYDDYWISYVVSELQGYGLTHELTDADAMGDAYEIFIGPQLKGESGQFFTPRAVVRLAVDMIGPQLSEREAVLDPACGSGGFLVYSLRAAQAEAELKFGSRSRTWVNNRVREYASNFIHGLDVEPLLYKVAKSYMAIVGNGRSGIFQEDSLLRPEEWKASTRARMTLERFDVVLTNPPFGTKIKVEIPDTLEQYDLGHGLRNGKRAGGLLRGGQDPAILFLERCWQFLTPSSRSRKGGRMAIVLPRQILSGHDPAMVEVRKWILKRMRVLAVVDLPPETFQPYTGTITSLLFGERNERADARDYEIFMAVAEYVGHDRRGRPLVRRNSDGSPQYDRNNQPVIQDDLPTIATAYATYRSGKKLRKLASPSIFAVRLRDIRAQAGGRLDAWYYDPSKNDVVKKIWDRDGVGGVQVRTIASLVRDPSQVFYPGRHKRNYCSPGPDAVPFLSSTNVLQVRPFDVKWQPRAYRPIAKHMIDKGWILITRSGSVGRVVFVGDELAGFTVDDGVAVSEHVIRLIPDLDEVDPGYLYAYLSSEVGKVLLSQGIYASVVKHITPQHILEIPVPLPTRDIQSQIGDLVRNAELMRQRVGEATRSVQRAIEEGVEGGGFVP